jgi:hypothetical protein
LQNPTVLCIIQNCPVSSWMSDKLKILSTMNLSRIQRSCTPNNFSSPENMVVRT